jgi:light-harvesting complex I chlorophyll a/b binding protein 1
LEDDNDVDEMGGEEFLRRELARLESLEDMLEDIEEYCYIDSMCVDDVDGDGNTINDNDDDYDFDTVMLDDLEKLDELFSLLQDSADDDDNAFENVTNIMSPQSGVRDTTKNVDEEDDIEFFAEASKELENALLQGVVPVDASVGRDTIPGDWGFDPFHLADKDYIRQAQYRLLQLLPGGNPTNDPPPQSRPAALVLRDYREAEIRHGRLAMLAVVCWPLQEKLDQLFLDDDQFGPILYGPVTLPYFPLLLTLIMLLLGYLDIYSKAIKEEEKIGDAFLPGDCFWDPLRILEGAPPSMKRNMQEREIINGRMAMIAFAAFVFEEAVSHRPLVTIPSNELLFEPLYQVSFVQQWLDQQFSNYH